jgi:hypothetical protein
MTGQQKHSNLLEEAQIRLSQLSPERLRVAVAFLTYLQGTEENKITEELLTIPGLTAFLGKAVQLNGQEQAKLSSNNNEESFLEDISHLIAADEEVWQSYLASKEKWQEVYRRLANS